MVRERVQPPKSTVSAGDAFTQIKGIGPVLEARLHHAGILTFAQLGARSPQSLAALVAGLSAKRIVRENWIKQARRLASQQARTNGRTRKTIRYGRQHYATFTIELLLNGDQTVRRTRVVHIQGEVDDTWPGWEESRLNHFLVRQARLRIPAPETGLSPEPVVVEVPLVSPLLPPSTERMSIPESTPPISALEIALSETHLSGLQGVLRLGDLTITPPASSLPRSSVYVGEEFAVHCGLELTEVVRAPDIPINYTILISARRLGEKDNQIVGEARGTFLPADRIPCSVKAAIGTQGTYRLEAMVTLTQQDQASLPLPGLMAIQRGSPLHVY